MLPIEQWLIFKCLFKTDSSRVSPRHKTIPPNHRSTRFPRNQAPVPPNKRLRYVSDYLGSRTTRLSILMGHKRASKSQRCHKARHEERTEPGHSGQRKKEYEERSGFRTRVEEKG